MRALRPSSKTRARPCTCIAIHRYNVPPDRPLAAKRRCTNNHARPPHGRWPVHRLLSAFPSEHPGRLLGQLAQRLQVCIGYRVGGVSLVTGARG